MTAVRPGANSPELFPTNSAREMPLANGLASECLVLWFALRSRRASPPTRNCAVTGRCFEGKCVCDSLVFSGESRNISEDNGTSDSHYFGQNSRGYAPRIQNYQSDVYTRQGWTYYPLVVWQFWGRAAEAS